MGRLIDPGRHGLSQEYHRIGDPKAGQISLQEGPFIGRQVRDGQHLVYPLVKLKLDFPPG